MKVIAHTPSGYLLECSLVEMANLHGFNSEYSDGYKRETKSVGYDVPVVHAREAMDLLRRDGGKLVKDATGYIEQLHARLKKLAELLPMFK
jgi:hypothetical protein